MLCVHWASWGLHVYQLVSLLFPALHLVYEQWFGVIRFVRPFIIVKFIRLVVKFKLPKNRIEQLLKWALVSLCSNSSEITDDPHSK